VREREELSEKNSQKSKYSKLRSLEFDFFTIEPKISEKTVKRPCRGSHDDQFNSIQNTLDDSMAKS
jgi:hypothetical protein